MGALAAYLESIAGHEGLNVPDDMYDSLAGIDAGAEAKIAELMEQSVALAAQLQAVQAHNYQLLTAGSSEPDGESEGEIEFEDEEVEADPEDAIEDLFEDEDEN